MPVPALGEHRRRHAEQLEQRVHPGFGAVRDLERAARHQRGRHQSDPPAITHPEREERQRADREHQRRHPQQEITGARVRERHADQVVERRVRIDVAEVGEQPADRPPSGHGGERLVERQAVRRGPQDAQHCPGGHDAGQQHPRHARRDRRVAGVCRSPRRIGGGARSAVTPQSTTTRRPSLRHPVESPGSSPRSRRSMPWSMATSLAPTTEVSSRPQAIARPGAGRHARVDPSLAVVPGRADGGGRRLPRVLGQPRAPRDRLLLDRVHRPEPGRARRREPRRVPRDLRPQRRLPGGDDRRPPLLRGAVGRLAHQRSGGGDRVDRRRSRPRPPTGQWARATARRDRGRVHRRTRSRNAVRRPPADHPATRYRGRGHRRVRVRDPGMVDREPHDLDARPVHAVPGGRAVLRAPSARVATCVRPLVRRPRRHPRVRLLRSTHQCRAVAHLRVVGRAAWSTTAGSLRGRRGRSDGRDAQPRLGAVRQVAPAVLPRQSPRTSRR